MVGSGVQVLLILAYDFEWTTDAQLYLISSKQI
jgi:hypothetical protein